MLSFFLLPIRTILSTLPTDGKVGNGLVGSTALPGTAVVTMDDAALWTDSRYFLAAEQQLEGTSFQLMRLKIKGTPSIAQWLGEKLKDGNAQVGVDGMCNNVSSVKDLVRDLRRQGGITVKTNFDPLNEIWKDRPSIPENKIEVHPMKYAGETTLSKIGRVRTALRDKGADGMLVSALDDIAWVLNLRGSDVHCNPVFVAYLLLSSHEATLFVDKVKLTPEVEDYLESQDVKVEAYEKVGEALEKYFEFNILLDPEETSYTLYNIIASTDSKAYAKEIVASASPIPAMKAVKNDAEIAGYRNAMLRDGVAMVKFLKWLKPAVEAGGQTEISIERQLTAFRAEQPLFRGISFDTIAGYNAHGAIVHYEATADTDIPLEPNGLLLLDSGAQYEDGLHRHHAHHSPWPGYRRNASCLHPCVERTHTVGAGKVSRRGFQDPARCSGSRGNVARGHELPSWHGSWSGIVPQRT